MFRTSAISFVIAMIFSSMIGTSFLDKGYHLRGGIGRWGEVNILFSMMEMSMLASTSPQNLCPPSRHANMLRIFQVCQRHCWRRPPRKTFVLRRGAPTWLRFSRSTGVIVGVDLPTKPLFFVRARQHASAYLDFPVPKNEITCIRKAILICRLELRMKQILSAIPKAEELSLFS